MQQESATSEIRTQESIIKVLQRAGDERRSKNLPCFERIHICMLRTPRLEIQQRASLRHPKNPPGFQTAKATIELF